MIKIDKFRYKAEKGKFIHRKSDNAIMGERICLGDDDSITNYKEKAYTKKSYKDFYKSIGVDVEEKEKESEEKEPQVFENNIMKLFQQFKNNNKKQ